jgi:hypothetical protein
MNSLFTNVWYLLKARIADPEEQFLLSNGYVTHNNGVTAGSGVSCAVCAEAVSQGLAVVARQS